MKLSPGDQWRWDVITLQAIQLLQQLRFSMPCISCGGIVIQGEDEIAPIGSCLGDIHGRFEGHDR